MQKDLLLVNRMSEILVIYVCTHCVLHQAIGMAGRFCTAAGMTVASPSTPANILSPHDHSSLEIDPMPCSSLKRDQTICPLIELKNVTGQLSTIEEGKENKTISTVSSDKYYFCLD